MPVTYYKQVIFSSNFPYYTKGISFLSVINFITFYFVFLCRCCLESIYKFKLDAQKNILFKETTFVSTKCSIFKKLLISKSALDLITTIKNITATLRKLIMIFLCQLLYNVSLLNISLFCPQYEPSY